MPKIPIPRIQLLLLFLFPELLPAQIATGRPLFQGAITCSVLRRSAQAPNPVSLRELGLNLDLLAFVAAGQATPQGNQTNPQAPQTAPPAPQTPPPEKPEAGPTIPKVEEEDFDKLVAENDLSAKKRLLDEFLQKYPES